jgi:hypothetical protein
MAVHSRQSGIRDESGRGPSAAPDSRAAGALQGRTRLRESAGRRSEPISRVTCPARARPATEENGCLEFARTSPGPWSRQRSWPVVTSGPCCSTSSYGRLRRLSRPGRDGRRLLGRGGRRHPSGAAGQGQAGGLSHWPRRSRLMLSHRRGRRDRTGRWHVRHGGREGGPGRANLIPEARGSVETQSRRGRSRPASVPALASPGVWTFLQSVLGRIALRGVSRPPMKRGQAAPR